MKIQVPADQSRGVGREEGVDLSLRHPMGSERVRGPQDAAPVDRIVLTEPRVGMPGPASADRASRPQPNEVVAFVPAVMGEHDGGYRMRSRLYSLRAHR
jgi:hypothetical protein